MKTPTTIDICVDCLFYLANGDIPEDRTDLPDILAPLDVTLGATDCELCIDGEQTMGPCEPWFSWRTCEACGSPLGGNRVHATLWVDA